MTAQREVPSRMPHFARQALPHHLPASSLRIVTGRRTPSPTISPTSDLAGREPAFRWAGMRLSRAGNGHRLRQRHPRWRTCSMRMAADANVEGARAGVQPSSAGDKRSEISTAIHDRRRQGLSTGSCHCDRRYERCLAHLHVGRSALAVIVLPDISSPV